MTYDLRRLRRNGFLTRIAGSRRYQLTADGRRLAVFLAKTYARVITPSLSELDPALPTEIGARSPLARAWRSVRTGARGANRRRRPRRLRRWLVCELLWDQARLVIVH
jgi:hypothetical protein